MKVYIILPALLFHFIACSQQNKTSTTPDETPSEVASHSYPDENPTTSEPNDKNDTGKSEIGCSDSSSQDSHNAITSTPQKTGSLFSQSDAMAIVKYHNKIRSIVNAGKIKWNSKIAKFAQNWANGLKKSCQINHRPRNKYGENLWMGTASAYSVVDAAKSWETEKQYYFGGKLNSSNWFKSGHYTQMVWKNSTELGCGKTVCNGNLIVVCNYNPPGNFMNQKPY